MDQQRKALHTAVVNGSVEEMTKIIGDGLAVTTDIMEGKYSVLCEKDTALVIAAKYGHMNCLKKLLELGAHIYVDGEVQFGHRYIPHDFTGALVNAASRDHLDCVHLLVETRILGSCSQDSLFIEFITTLKTQNYNFDCLEKLLSDIDDSDRQSLLKGWKGHCVMNLFLLCAECPVSCLKYLIEHGVSVNGWDWNGLTPLIVAILAQNFECVQFLLAEGADLKMPDQADMSVFEPDGNINSFVFEDRDNEGVWSPGSGRVALMYLACMGNPTILDLVLQCATMDDVNWCEGSRGFTPVMFAASLGDGDSVSLFLRFDAIVNLIDFSGISPLDCAVSSENVDCVELLLKNMSNEFYPNSFGLCVYQNIPDLLRAIIKHYNETKFLDLLDQSYLMDAIIYDSLESAQVLLENGHGVDFRNSTGMTALMLACMEEKVKGVEMLVKHGADVNAQTQEGVTPLMFAACKNHGKCLQLLLDYQADVDVVDYHKGTVFSAAMIQRGPCLDILLDSGKLYDSSDDENLRLKSIHKEAMTVYKHHGYFPVQSLVSTMEKGLFEWEWTNASSLKTIAFSAVTLGVSPTKFNHNDSVMSLLTFAILYSDRWDVLKYLISNLYFFPEDYPVLIQKAGLVLKELIDNDVDFFVPISFYETISSQPLSLKSWSFLHVSKAISLRQHSIPNSNPNITRSDLIDTLPIPEKLKMKLKFRSYFSHLCSKHWSDIGSAHETEFHQLADLMFEKRMFWRDFDSLKKCSASDDRDDCVCEGFGRTLGDN